MNILKNKNVILIAVVFLLVFAPYTVEAASLMGEIGEKLRIFQTQAQLPGNPTLSPMTIVIDIINVALSLLGIYFVIIIMYAGYTWMTAQGDKDKVTKARDTIKNGVIGVIIILLSWVIANYVVEFAIDLASGDIGPDYEL